MARLRAASTVKTENMAVECATSPHLMPPLVRLMGSSNAPMHWKKRMMAIPGIGDEVSTDGWRGGSG